MVFKGKVGIGYYLIAVLYNVLPFSIHLFKMNWLNIALLVIYYLGNFIIIPPIIKNKVEISDRNFILYFGFQKKIFNIDEIIDIHRSYCPLSSSACSLDRIYINLKHQEVYISLKDNNGFIKKIKQMRPTLNKKN